MTEPWHGPTCRCGCAAVRLCGTSRSAPPLCLRSVDAEELSRRTRSGEGWVPQSLATLLMQLGHVDVVRRQAEEGDWFCALALSSSLAEQGSGEAAVVVLAPFADSGWWPAVNKLADLLTSLHRLDEVVTLVEPHLESDPTYYQDLAVSRLARTLARLGRHKEAFEAIAPSPTQRCTPRPAGWRGSAASAG